MLQKINAKYYFFTIKTLLQLFLIVTLTSCETITETLENINLTSANKKKLPGKRISILVQQRSIEPDTIASRHQIILPAPKYNESWSQTGGNASHAMHHLRLSGGLEEEWSTSIGEGASGSERLIAQPIIAKDNLFAIDAETTVSSYNLSDGKNIWVTELTPDHEGDGHINGGLAFENDKIFAATGFGQIVALSAKTGEVLWRRDVGIPFRTAPTARNNRVFVISITNKLFK